MSYIFRDVVVRRKKLFIIISFIIAAVLIAAILIPVIITRNTTATREGRFFLSTRKEYSDSLYV
jgi:hypothetical protein